jgi:hypothetical protein
MGEVIRFVPKSELERARLIREARAMYESIFPPAAAIGEARDIKRQVFGTSGAGPMPEFDRRPPQPDLAVPH